MRFLFPFLSTVSQRLIIDKIQEIAPNMKTLIIGPTLLNNTMGVLFFYD